MLAICCLSLIVSNDPHRSLLDFMASKGYVQDFINRLQADDRFLSALSTCSSATIRKLYVYEAKMVVIPQITIIAIVNLSTYINVKITFLFQAFFLHLAGSSQGARHLLCCGLIKCLGNMQALDARPEQFR